MSELNSLPPSASDYRGRRRAQPTPDTSGDDPAAAAAPVAPPPLTRRQLLEQRRAAEQAEAEAQAATSEAAAEQPDSDEPTAGAGEQGRDQDSGPPTAPPTDPPSPPTAPADPWAAGERPSPWGAEGIPQPRPARVELPTELPTRRQLAEQRRAAAHAGSSRGHGPRLSAVALGAATVAIVAVTAGHAFGSPPAQVSAAAELPTGVAATPQLDPLVSSSTVMAALRTGPSFDLPVGVRASRSSNRPVLPGCNGEVTSYTYANGHVPADELCALTFAPGHHLRADAAVALARLNIAYRARFGHNVCLTDSYRTIASQESLAARKPGLAAVPGTSEHGMGLAVDFCDGVEKYRSVEYNWMRANAPAFGWQNPDWAIPPSSREEPWHWEYVVGEAKTPGSQHLIG